jgi:two-component system, OmpR family, response regulator MprA
MGRLLELLRSRGSEPIDNPRRPAPPARVLLVEGEPAVRGSLAQALRDEGCDVVEASGAELQRRVRAIDDGDPVDLVISDVQTLDPLGLAALADLRRVDWVMPILLIASDDERETRKQARKLHASAVFSRPLHVDAVQQTVRAIIPA